MENICESALEAEPQMRSTLRWVLWSVWNPGQAFNETIPSTNGKRKQQSASGNDHEIGELRREAGCAPLKIEHAKDSAFIIFETPFLFIDIQKTIHPVKPSLTSR
jgi:hypothetical protein